MDSTTAWTEDQLERIGTATELEIATERGDGTLRTFVPIWVVRAGGQVFVRTWHRRDTGWYGHAVSSAQARIRVPGLEVDVTVENVGDRAGLRRLVDDAYRAKYGGFGSTSVSGMVTDEASESTLRLTPR